MIAAKLFRAADLSRITKALAAGVTLLLAGCILPPPGPTLSGPLPPAAPGTARLVFYRDLDPYTTQSMPTVYLNTDAAGISQNGAVFYRDVAPGTYTISVAPSLPYPNQFKTVVVKPGDVFYVEIAPLPTGGGRFNINQRDYGDTFIVTVRDPVSGAGETQGLRVSG
jgi:hypothetical protein